MPAVINSSPSCIIEKQGATPADDSADFILQARFEDCAGFGTFMPGSTYGDEGTSAETAYYILTWLGIVVMVVALIAWVAYENRRLIAQAVRIRGRAPVERPPQPGMTSRE